MLQGVDLFFGRLCEPLQDCKALPYRDSASLTSEVNSTSLLVCLSSRGVGGASSAVPRLYGDIM